MTPPRWFKGCLTAWAMRHARWLWQVGEWKQMASNNDSPGDEPAAA